jgi:hypothetical protein
MSPIFYEFIGPDSLSVILTWTIALNLVLLIILVPFNLKSILYTLNISKRSWILAFLLFLSALCIRNFLSPWIHEDFYNEWAFMEGAQAMILNGKYALCNFGDQNVCLGNLVVPKHPAGVPFILSVSFILFGVSDQVAMYTNIFYGSASVILIFMVGYLVSGREDIGLYASLFFSLVPIHVRYSGTVLLGPVSVFFQLLTVMFFLLSLRINRRSMWFLFFLALGYTLQTRPECILLIVLFISGYFMMRPQDLKKANISLHHVMVFFLILLPHAIHMANNISIDAWKEGKDIPYFSMAYLINHLTPYTSFWFNPHYQLFIYPFVFIFGVFYLFQRAKNILWFLALWFLIFLAFFIPYHMNPVGSITSYRYMLSGYVPYCLMAAYGIYFLSRRIPIKRIHVAFLIIIAVSFLPHISHIRYKDPLRLAEMEIMKDVENEIGNDCFVIGHRALFSIKKKFIYPHFLLEDEDAFNQLRDVTDCLYLFQDISTMKSGWAERILSKCPHTLIASREVMKCTYTRPVTLAFYKLDLDACPR